MNKSEQIQVNTLSRWVTVKLAPSEVDGVGVFAVRDLPEGTRVFMDIMPEIFNLPAGIVRNNLPDFVKDIVLAQYPKANKGEPFVYPTCRFVAYCNHSDEPNYDAKKDVLLKSVKAGEEITEDYRLIDGYEEVYPFLV